MPSDQAGSASMETAICPQPPVSACAAGFAAHIRPIPRIASKIRGALNCLSAPDCRTPGLLANWVVARKKWTMGGPIYGPEKWVAPFWPRSFCNPPASAARPFFIES